MLWVKAFHVSFMVTWFAGLFYLPRLFIYHVQAEDRISIERFEVMERRLGVIMAIGAAGTLIFGFWLLFGWWWPPSAGWLHAKLALVAALIGYHGYLQVIARRLRSDHRRYSHGYLRWVNEAPAVLLIAIVVLVVVKPF